MQIVHIIAYKGTVVNNHINCLVIQKQFFLSILHPNVIVCYFHIGILLCFSYILQNYKTGWGFWVDILMHYNSSHLK